MFRRSRDQGSLFEPAVMLPQEKIVRLKSSWADIFRSQALPIIREELFASLFFEGNGRPNRPVKLVVGVLILKEVFDLTDMEALEQLEWNILWHHAFGITADEAHLSQKTLHNFRVGMMQMDGGLLLFKEMTGKILEILGTSTKRQRLDSTHITSNIARLTRLGLFCETMRVYLRALRTEHPRLFQRIDGEIVDRYLKGDDATRFEGAKGDDVRRRLGVCARDLGRLVVLFQDTGAKSMDEFKLLMRLLDEQCDLGGKDATPGRGDEDHEEGGEPVVAKDPKEVGSDSLQSPHDPDVTYNGHKGKGYEVQIAETVGETNDVEIITHVEVTPSCVSDVHATVATLQVLSDRDLKPDELLADTTYGSAANFEAAAAMQTELISPRRGEEKTAEFKIRYAPRAGIEATNSELKRAHGLGRLRVRGGQAVRLAVFIKALACNIKRMVRAIAARIAPKTGLAVA